MPTAEFFPVADDVIIVEPVLIEAGCTLERCTIGPNVTLESGTTVRESTIADSIIGARCVIERSRLSHSMLGEGVLVRDYTGSGSLGAKVKIGSELTAIAAGGNHSLAIKIK